MPELPEVETVRRGLQPVMEGALIERVEQRRPDLRFPFPNNFAARLAGRTVTAVSRRAKYLTFHFDTDPVLISHLGMSGSFRIEDDEGMTAPGVFHQDRSKLAAHDHAVFHLKSASGLQSRVVFNDPRRFGFMLFAEAAQLSQHPMLSGLGVEPTGNALDGNLINTLFSGRRAPLKAALLDQRLIAGLGNIYVCEALWRAGLSPRRSAGSITSARRPSTDRTEALAQATREVIADAIAAGGSSLRDYVHTDGSLGYFQHRFDVYDREGEPCRRMGCKGVVQRIVQSGRSTFYCAACQR
ncbi:MAG: bifunctional DNA-formamidopyrimidine glycosylase/DNA-(apurinic or apyrimidinic site) lyase [Rhizobiaceae bacterium]|nr:bifunctional DNA-formamidopyrimidine glycosylase/DNA-(apurinic or apyrimidinic site) lyase [Rhizobiaceae bacterium]